MDRVTTTTSSSAAAMIRFKSPPPLVSMRRSRIFVTKLRELSKVHVGEQHTPTVTPEQKKKKKTQFRPIKSILDWAEGTEILTCSGPCKPTRVFRNHTSSEIRQQQYRVVSLHDDKNLREFIFGSAVGKSENENDSSSSSSSTWTADDDQQRRHHYYLDSSLYTTDHGEDDVTFDDTTISTWADDSSRQ